MIDFRYHLVSIIAVFLALTVGLVLGTTMLQDPLLDTLQNETADLRGQTEDLRSERDVADRVNAGADQMVDAASADMLDGRLEGLDVVVVQAPGADADTAASLGERVEEAGGRIAGRVEIAPEFVDPANTAFVDELALQVSADAGSLSGSGPYEKAGIEIGRALARVPEPEEDEDEDGEEDGEEAEEGGHDPASALAAFVEGGLLTVRGEPAGRSDVVVMVSPSSAEQAGRDDRETVNTVLTAFVSALHDRVGGLVLTGDVPSSHGHGMIAQARAEEADFATVDMAGRPMGDIVAVLALAEDIDGDGGAYGVGAGVDGFLPDPLPEPRGTADTEPSPEPSDGLDEARRVVPDGE
ncbi:copper transporter [Nocardiopsis sp. N85]|uniref:copper transporter n=1 Tax=Nocardiopsis sp. N85 TaxID=3029400 RepID=UPI00237F8ECD|nr:copper transporter [Nocardiopsis sp. N85]MDE3723764.1 copper transporter [Nocardiopsis sp. N85]